MKKTVIILLLLLVAIQFIRPARTNPPVDPAHALHADEEVIQLLRQSCYDCHSNETRWPWYSQIAPISWSIASHVDDGREALNFSEWTQIDPKIKAKRLKRAIQTTRNGMMPLPMYLWIHKDAKLSREQKKVIEKWATAELEKLEKSKTK